MASPLPVLPAVRLLSILAPIVGGAAVLAWRVTLFARFRALERDSTEPNA